MQHKSGFNRDQIRMFSLEQMVDQHAMGHSGFNLQEIESELKKYSWNLIEELGYEELNNRYVKPTGRKLGVMEIERIVFAVKS